LAQAKGGAQLSHPTMGPPNSMTLGAQTAARLDEDDIDTSALAKSMPTPASPVEKCPLEELEQLLPTFTHMQARRLDRVLNGRVRRNNIMRHTTDLFWACVVMLLIVHLLHVEWSRFMKYRWIPAVVSVVMFVSTCVEVVWRPEHVFTQFLRTELNIFFIWFTWEYNYEEHRQHECYPWRFCFLEKEEIMLKVFLCVTVVVLTLLFGHYCVMPWILRRAILHGSGMKLCWSIRPSKASRKFQRSSPAWAGKSPESYALEAGSCSLPGHSMHTTGTGQGCLRCTNYSDASPCSNAAAGEAACGSGERTGSPRTRVSTFTYKPPSSWWNRVTFGYDGQKDSRGRPHGEGMWFDDSFHGECLHGIWQEGLPKGEFISREYGTGAQFAQRPVAYATSRADCAPTRLAKSFKFPRKDEVLRFGIAQVEVSFAGGFFPFLPAVRDHQACESVAGVMKKLNVPSLDESRSRPRSREQVELRLTVATEEQLRGWSLQDGVGQQALRRVDLPVCFREGDRYGFLDPESLVSIRSLVDPPYEALVFFHGFNADLSTSLGRMAQMFALGNMPPHVVPFVFSYSAGFALSYLPVKRHMSLYGDDLRSFLKDLGQHFREVHVLCHSCGAEFFFMHWERIADCFAASRALPQRSREDSKRHCGIPLQEGNFSSISLGGSSFRDTRPHLVTLTLVNPDVLIDKVSEKLPKMMNVVEHFTTYNDKKDGALFWSGFVQSFFPGCLLTGTTLPDAGRRPAIFGSIVSPLWLEEVPRADGGGGTISLRGPLTEEPARAKKFGPLAKEVNMASAEGARLPSWGSLGHDKRDDQRIDVIDCSSVDQNIHKLRHNYYMLNTQVVEDICDLIGNRQPARHRSRLVCVEANVFNFLCPPADLMEM